MTQARALRSVWTGLVMVLGLACTGTIAAQTITVASLQQLLKQAPSRELRFHETRESPWLSAPAQSSGRMKSTATMLEKNVEQPRRETWRILSDRMQLSVPGTAEVKEIMLADAPAVAVLAHALRHTMAADLHALEADFTLVPGGDQRLWTLRLTPRRPEVARLIHQLELQGSGALLQAIVVLEDQGVRTITRLSPEP